MPGYLPGIPGLLAFEAVKFGGYVLAAEVLRRVQPTITANRYALAATRTGLGILIGPPVMFGLTWAASFAKVAESILEIGFFVLLFALSFLVWALVLRLFVPKVSVLGSRLWTYSLLAAAWSLLLDVAGVALAFIAPGKVAFC
jgi:hypothetical protein